MKTVATSGMTRCAKWERDRVGRAADVEPLFDVEPEDVATFDPVVVTVTDEVEREIEERLESEVAVLDEPEAEILGEALVLGSVILRMEAGSVVLALEFSEDVDAAASFDVGVLDDPEEGELVIVNSGEMFPESPRTDRAV